MKNSEEWDLMCPLQSNKIKYIKHLKTNSGRKGCRHALVWFHIFFIINNLELKIGRRRVSMCAVASNIVFEVHSQTKCWHFRWILYMRIKKKQIYEITQSVSTLDIHCTNLLSICLEPVTWLSHLLLLMYACMWYGKLIVAVT